MAMTTFRIGRVAGTTLQLWGKNLVPVVVITALLHAPLMLWTLSWLPHELFIRSLTGFELTTALIALPINLLVSALLASGVVAAIEGRPLSLGGWLRSGATRFVTALITVILVSLCIGGISVIVAIPFAFGAPHPLVVSSIATLLTLWLLALWYAAGPVSVIEGTGSLAAIGRGRALTKGHRLAILGFLILWLIAARGLWWLELLLMLGGTGGTIQVAHYLYIDFIRECLVGSLGGVMAGVTYYFLRADRDGADPQQLATVFE
jgi:hypothetical protein